MTKLTCAIAIAFLLGITLGGCADKTLTDAMKRLQVVKVTDIAKPNPFQDSGE